MNDEQELQVLATDEEGWKEKLGPKLYEVMRGRGTEAPFTGVLLKEKRDGTYRCAACGQKLFASGTKFDSGTGWPSFDQALPGSVEMIDDNSMGMHRTEVRCSRCHSHLGHQFNDGPTSTGARFCMNSIALKFDEKK
jgi:peptide-methionine (R)-S-oxide reductase